MVEFVDLSEWKKMRDIRFELHYEYGINISRDGREFRYAVQKWNERFFAGEAPYFITHSVQKGYKATRDFNEAKIAMNDYISRSRIMEKQARGIQQGFERLNNCKYDFESGEII